MTYKKKLLYFFHVIYILEKVILKTKLMRLHHDNFLANHFKIIKNSYFNIQKILLIQDNKKFKRICKKLQYVLIN